MENLVDAPCKDCTDRKPLCHSTCEKYAEYKKKANKIRVKRAASRIY